MTTPWLRGAVLASTIAVAMLAASVISVRAGAIPSAEVPTLAPLLREVTPAVVNIATRTRVQVRNPLLDDPFFRRFFNIPPQARERQVQSAGSGVVIDAARGHVITNHHVVDKADEVIVTSKEGRRYTARVIGSDAGTDIALLQIEVNNLTAIRLGDSDRLEVGDYVVAIGNPFGLGQTVTSGIVSALGRSGIGAEGYEDFIQTDASINPGNSGGALVNLRGELVGINTAILAPGGGNIGIGFAVPINMARGVVDQLVRFGEVRRGRLGVEIQDLTPELAESMGIAGMDGAVVTRIEPRSAAERAGLRAGDVIVAVDGRRLRGSSDLRNRIGLVRVGDTVEVTFVRRGAQQTVRVRIDPAESQPQRPRQRPSSP